MSDTATLAETSALETGNVAPHLKPAQYSPVAAEGRRFFVQIADS